jgi:hypothetical protein
MKSDLIVKLNKKNIKDIISEYLYIAMGNPPDPYDLKEIICFCEKIKKES